MRCIAISDTHCRLDEITIPEGDLLAHAGDLTFRGNIEEISKELSILKTLPHKHKLLICGNHDWLGERNSPLMRQMCADAGVTYLENESITIDGINFYGSPVTPEFCGWAFNIPRDKLKPYWDAVPDNTEILITHGPPYGILDKCPDGSRVGCEALLYRIKELKSLKFSIFGHIHHSWGVHHDKSVSFINASVCTERYKPNNSPIIFDI